MNIKVTKINDRNVFVISPVHNSTDKGILYLHGGGYIHNTIIFHWKFLKLLIEKLNCTVVLPDYPLAPEYTYEDSFKLVESLYKELIAQKGSKNIIFMGDSAGGGFCLALAQKMKNQNIDQPSKIILLSPWLDISLCNPDIKNIDPNDLILGVEGLRLAGKSYAGNTDVNNYLVSPINGPLEGLGKISIFIGTYDIFVADTRKYKTLCELKGVNIDYFEYEKMPHIWMLFDFPESKKAINEIVDLINRDIISNSN
jgi:acetyl esterase/lipase